MSRIEVVCRCHAYNFPHRFSGGRCNGYSIVAQQWETFCGGGDCTDCNSLVNGDAFYCEVYSKQENRLECPVLVDYLQLNDQKLKRTDKWSNK